MQKIISDTQTKIKNSNDRKIYLYSAHENNIAELLIVLGIFEPLHIPDYGSYVTFEVHKIGDEYGIKVDKEKNLTKIIIWKIFRFIMKITQKMDRN